jgi:hypothetical protein
MRSYSRKENIKGIEFYSQEPVPYGISSVEAWDWSSLQRAYESGMSAHFCLSPDANKP